MRVRGYGPSPNEFLLLGTHPGPQEAKAGIPFVGRTGDEIDRFMNGVDLPRRSDVFCTNLNREYYGKDYVYTHKDLELDEPELIAELEQVRPTIIVTLGAGPMRWFLGDVDLDAVESLPWRLPKGFAKYPNAPVDCVVWPITHPASAFHAPEQSPYIVKGWKNLARFLDGEIEPKTLFEDPYPETTYAEITERAALERNLAGLVPGGRVFIDSEGWPHNPWSLQFSVEPGTGYLLRYGPENTDLLATFAALLRRKRATVVCHSALHERAMFRAMGIGELNDLRFDDTMVMAYLLQIEPKGLKQACLRHCNMQMLHYDEVIGDTANYLTREYLTAVWDLEQREWEKCCRQEFERRRNEVWTDAKGKTRVGRKITKIPELPKTQLHKAAVRILQSKTPYKLFKDQVEDVEVTAYNLVGPLPEATLDFVPAAISVPYGCRDSDGTGRLLAEYAPMVDAMGLREVYDLELSTYPFIDRMQQVGLLPDLDHFAGLSERLGHEIQRLQGALIEATHRPSFNANSGDQVADYLFGDLGLDPIKLVSSGRGSTNDKILEALEREHPEFPALATIRSYRETYKLKHTFVDRLPDYVHRWPHDGRVHATFRTTSVVTGRLAASDPNVLAQPEHGRFAKDFKRGWVAGEGHVLYQADESQVELRVLAHLSRDPVLLAVYRGEARNADGSKIDLHAKLAQRIFGGDVRKYMHKCNERLAAKAVNFGIPMGMSNRGLSVELRKNGVEADETTAQQWLDETMALYKGVAAYMDHQKAEARRNGFIRCLSGRVRYIGGIRSRDERTREEAERFSFSTPIQEGASMLMKKAEATIYEDVLPYFWRDNIYCEPILQVHDCLKFECAEDAVQDLHQMVEAAMTIAPRGFAVPLEIEAEFGPTMADMETL